MDNTNKVRISAFILIGIAFVVALVMVGVLGASAIGFIGALKGAFTGTEVAVLATIAISSTLVLGIIVALHLAAAFGLLKGKRWARRLATGLAIVQLFNFLLGTVCGIFILHTLYSKPNQSISKKEAQFSVT